jgi:hypothetical protein
MEQTRQMKLDRLRRELEFLDNGGYTQSAQSPWRAPYLFEESPSCPNFSERSRPHACPECWLMQFVAPELREEQVPCRFVQLSRDGVTVDSLYRSGTPAESNEALRGWLQYHIHEIEQQIADAKQLKLA